MAEFDKAFYKKLMRSTLKVYMYIRVPYINFNPLSWKWLQKWNILFNSLLARRLSMGQQSWSCRGPVLEMRHR